MAIATAGEACGARAPIRESRDAGGNPSHAGHGATMWTTPRSGRRQAGRAAAGAAPSDLGRRRLDDPRPPHALVLSGTPHLRAPHESARSPQTTSAPGAATPCCSIVNADPYQERARFAKEGPVPLRTVRPSGPSRRRAQRLCRVRVRLRAHIPQARRRTGARPASTRMRRTRSLREVRGTPGGIRRIPSAPRAVTRSASPILTSGARVRRRIG